MLDGRVAFIRMVNIDQSARAFFERTNKIRFKVSMRQHEMAHDASDAFGGTGSFDISE